jgi:hypothetical protein
MAGWRQAVEVAMTDEDVARLMAGNGKIKHREFAMASGEMTDQEFTDFLTVV